MSAANITAPARVRRIPPELNIILVLVCMAAVFEALGWIRNGNSFLFNIDRLKIMILQESVIGIIAVGMTQVIITGGIDLSSGSVVGATAMIAASFAQSSDYISRAVFPSLTDLPFIVPVLIGLLVGLAAGLINGGLIAYTGIPPFIATLGMYISARGLARWYTNGQPVSFFTPSFDFIGSGLMPVIIFLVTAAIFHVALRYTRYGKFTYAIGANRQAAKVSGINVSRHLVTVYAIAGLLSGLAGIVTIARAQTGQAGAGVTYELQAIAATVIGGTALTGGSGRMTGTVFGTIILGMMLSGFTFLGISAFFQDIIMGIVVVAAVIIRQGVKPV